MARLLEAGSLGHEAALLDSLGYARHQLNDHDSALLCYRAALGLWRRLGEVPYQAEALTHLAETYRATGDHDAARGCWQQAVAILDGLQHPDAIEVRHRLQDLDVSDSARHRHDQSTGR